MNTGLDGEMRQAGNKELLETVDIKGAIDVENDSGFVPAVETH